MKNSGKLPIGVAIMLTMMAAGAQKANALTPNVSPAETKQEESIGKEANREKELQKESQCTETAETISTNTDEKTQTPNDEKSELVRQDTTSETITEKSNKTESAETDENKKSENYTVEFTYDDLQYVLPGGKSVKLDEILKKVGLSGTPTEAVSSNDELFTAEKENGEWIVKSKKAFKTNETLKVTIDKILYTISVTDDYVLPDGASFGGYIKSDGSMSWTLYDDGTLFISGKGEMPDYASKMENRPWHKYLNDYEDGHGSTAIEPYVYRVIIDEGITYIGTKAFKASTKIKEVFLPNSVTDIGGDSNETNGAFGATPDGMHIYCGDSLGVLADACHDHVNRQFNNYANQYFHFHGMPCGKSGSMIYAFVKPSSGQPTGHKDSWDSAYGLTNDHLMLMGYGQMKDYSSSTAAPWTTKNPNVVTNNTIKSLEIHNVSNYKKITSIGAYAFQNHFQMSTVKTDSSYSIDVSTIGERAFANCNALSNGTNGLALTGNITEIKPGVFENCKALPKITMPNGVKTIGESAFKFCQNLSNMNGNSTRNINLPTSLTTIGASAFDNCRKFDKVAMPNTVTSLGASAFNGCTALTQLTLPTGLTAIPNSLAAGCTALTSISIPANVTSIGASAFTGSGLTSVSIPNKVKTIGESAFKNCSNLATVTIPTSINSGGINVDAFLGLKAYAEITYNGKGTELESKCCSGTSSLSPIQMCFGVTNSIGSGSTGHYIYHLTQSVIYVKGSNHGTIPSNSTYQTYSSGDFTLTAATPNTGYRFDGYYDNENMTGTAVTKFSKSTYNDKTFYAKFSPIVYSITYNNVTGAQNPNTITSYTIETNTITLQNATKSGSKFDGWFKDSGYQTAISTIPPQGSTGNLNLYAKWTAKAEQNVGFGGGVDNTTLTLAKTYGDEDFTTALTGVIEGQSSISYESGTTNTATINSTNGLVSIQNAGTTTITASIPETENYLATSKSYTLTVAKANPIFTAPTPNTNLVYNTQAQALITEGSTNHGTMKYALDSSEDANFGTAVPTVTNAGKHVVYYKVVGDSNHENSAIGQIGGVGIAKADRTGLAISINGWTYDGTCKANPELSGNLSELGENDVKYTYTLNHYLAEPTCEVEQPIDAGEYTVKATIAETDNYLGGEISTNFTVSKADPTVTAPSAKTNLVYNTQAQELINAGSTIGGTMKYSLSPTADFDTTIPTATNAGTHRVYYKVVGDNNYNDSAVSSVDVTIAKANPTVTAPTAKTNLVYNTQARELINAGSTVGGTMKYSLSSDGVYDTAVPTAVSAGTHTVYYKVVGDNNYNDSAVSSVDVTIAKAPINPTLTISGWTYDGTCKADPILSGNLGNGTVTYTYTLQRYLAEPPYNVENPVDAGQYTVTANIAETENYNQATVTQNFTVSQAQSTANIVSTASVVRGGNTKNLSGNVSGVPTGATVTYTIINPLKGCVVNDTTGVFTSGDTAGSCVVRVSVSGTNNYLPKTADITVTVTEKAEINLDVSQDGMVYGDGELNPPSYTKPAQVGTESIEYKGTLRNGTEYGPTAEIPTNAGEYLVKVVYETIDKIYQGLARFIISPREIANAIITLGENLTYNGEVQTQTVDGITLQGNDITEFCDIEDNTALNAGNYLLTATAKDTGNYTGTATKEFKVAKSASEIGKVWADEVKNTFDTSAAVLHRENQTIPGTLSLIESELLYGTNTYNWVFTPDDTTNYETATGTVDITVSGTYYSANEGMTWRKGSEKSLSFTFKRMLNDEDTFDHIAAVNVDNQRVPEVYYNKHRGSVIIDLSPKYLETLSAGEHTLSAIFDNGEIVDAKFTVLEKEAEPEESKAEEPKAESKIVRTVKTGDSSNLSFWATLFASSPIGYCLNAFSNKRRKKK